MSPKRVRLTLRSAWSVYCLGRKSCRAELLSSYLSVPDSAPAKPPNPCRHPERSSRSLRPGRSEGSLTVRGRRRAGGMWTASLSPPPPITFSDSSLRAAPPSPARRSVQNDSVFLDRRGLRRVSGPPQLLFEFRPQSADTFRAGSGHPTEAGAKEGVFLFTLEL